MALRLTTLLMSAGAVALTAGLLAAPAGAINTYNALAGARSGPRPARCWCCGTPTATGWTTRSTGTAAAP